MVASVNLLATSRHVFVNLDTLEQDVKTNQVNKPLVVILSHSLSDCTLPAESSFRLLDFELIEKDSAWIVYLVPRACDPFGQH